MYRAVSLTVSCRSFLCRFDGGAGGRGTLFLVSGCVCFKCVDHLSRLDSLHDYNVKRNISCVSVLFHG